MEFRRTPADDPAALALLEAYRRELGAEGIRLDDRGGGSVGAEELTWPRGDFVLVHDSDGVPIACGGVRICPGPPAYAEIKRMYVVPPARGAGLARRLLAHLEARGAALGADRARLDTGREMEPALGLYRTSGYREIPDYNGNPDAGWWFEKTLTEEAG